VAAAIGAKPAKHVGRWLYERWAVSVLDRVARQGADVGTELRERAIAAVDHTKRLIGEWEAQTTEALTHMSRAPLGVGRRHATAVRTLSEVVPFSLAAPMAEAAGLLGGGRSTPVAPSEARAYFTRFHPAAEGILDRAALTPEEQRIVDLYQGLRNRIVESAAAMGVEMRLRDGTWAPVQPDPARQRMLRRWTPEGIDVLRNAFDEHGNPTPDGQALALAIAEANGWAQTKALAELRAYSDRADMVRNSVEDRKSVV